MDYFKPSECQPVILIPARANSTRLPRKMVRQINGKLALQYPLDAAKATGFNYCVATDCPLIAKMVGGNYCMTAEHPTGTDRCSEAARFIDSEYYIILAGDETCVQPAWLLDFARFMQAYPAHVGTIVTANPRYSYIRNSQLNTVMDISRHPIGDLEGTGIYWYPRHILAKFPALQGPYSECEGIELLRVIENGYPVVPFRVDAHPGLSLNTPEDVPLIEAWLTANAV